MIGKKKHSEETRAGTVMADSDFQQGLESPGRQASGRACEDISMLGELR